MTFAYRQSYGDVAGAYDYLQFRTLKPGERKWHTPAVKSAWLGWHSYSRPEIKKTWHDWHNSESCNDND